MNISLAILLFLVGFGGLAAFGIWRKISNLPNKEKKALIKQTINGIFVRFEARGWLPRTPAFDPDYLATYPALARLEAAYPDVRDECLALLEIKDKLTDMSAMGGSYTQQGIHTARWKTFVFKSGQVLSAKTPGINCLVTATQRHVAALSYPIACTIPVVAERLH